MRCLFSTGERPEDARLTGHLQAVDLTTGQVVADLSGADRTAARFLRAYLGDSGFEGALLSGTQMPDGSVR